MTVAEYQQYCIKRELKNSISNNITGGIGVSTSCFLYMPTQADIIHQTYLYISVRRYCQVSPTRYYQVSAY